MSEPMPSPAPSTPAEAKSAEAEKSRSQKYLLHPLAIDLVGFGSSILAGGLTAWNTMDTRVYKNLSSLGAWDDVKLTRKKHFDAIEAEVVQKKISPQEAYQKLDQLIEYNEKRQAVHLSNFGIDTLRDRWGVLRRHQKIEVALLTTAACGVTLGSIIPLMRSIVRPEQQELVDKVNHQAATPER